MRSSSSTDFSRRRGRGILAEDKKRVEFKQSKRVTCAFEDCCMKTTLGLPTCGEHAWEVFDHLAQKFTLKSFEQRMRSVKAEQETIPLPEPKQPVGTKYGLVYFIRSAGFIKIGFTQNLTQRFRAYPPDAELLAVYEGSTKDERVEHSRFCGDLAERREWFRESDAVAKRINEVRHREGDPRRFLDSGIPKLTKPGPRSQPFVVKI